MAADSDDDAYSTASDISSISSPTSASAACIKTFDTTELLELILLFLPLRDLLQAHRVCRPWSACIKTSIKARRALYMEPQSDVTSLYLKWDRMDEKPESPWPFFANGDWVDDTGCTVLPILNPLLTRNFFYKEDKRPGNPSRFNPLHHNGIISPHWQTEGKRGGGIVTGPSSKLQLRAIHRPDASWRQMFVMQPPCSELNFICRDVDRETVELVVVAREDGITMGDVVDRLREHWFECPEHVAFRGPHEGAWDFEGFLSHELQVFSEEEVDELSAWNFVQHLEYLGASE